MNDPAKKLCCVYCNEPLSKVDMPLELAWDHPIQYVCFNDDCSYFVEGWEWMWETYGSKVSYRYRVIDAEKQVASPLMVWSKAAIRNHIAED